MTEIEDIVEDEDKAKRLEEIIERKVEERVSSNKKTGDERSEEVSRRGFLRKIGAGALGFGVLSLPAASAFNIRSSDALEVYSNGNKYFDVEPGGPVKTNNADLQVDGQLTAGTNGNFYTDTGILSSVRLDGEQTFFEANTTDSTGHAGIELIGNGESKARFEWSAGSGHANIEDAVNNSNWVVFNPGGSVDVKTNLEVNGSTVWHAGNDGSGSSLEADQIDGYDVQKDGTDGSGVINFKT